MCRHIVDVHGKKDICILTGPKGHTEAESRLTIFLDELSKLATHYGFIDKGTLVREMSAQELNDACKKCVALTVSDTAGAVRALEALGYAADVGYKIFEDGRIDVYAQPNITQLVHAFDKQGCELVTVREHDETLEGFFISLVGGEQHD